MDLLKQLTGKNPAEYENAAKNLVNEINIDLFKKLVEQDDFLFDFVKNNVSKRIQNACNKNNFLNLMKFLDFYSASYDTMIAEVLHQYGGLELLPAMKEIFLTDNDAKKAYAAKFFTFVPNEYLEEILPQIRQASQSEFEPLSINSIEVLSKVNDSVSKNGAIEKLKSDDEFEQYNAVKFLVTFKAKDTLNEIINVMKKSSLAENIASEIPYLISLEELLKNNFEDCILVLCNIVNAIPEIIPPSYAVDYNLFEIFENIYYENLTPSSALLLRMAKDKFGSLADNEEYLFDCDKNTKEEVFEINKFLSGINEAKLDSLLYDELYEESDFVFFALDYANDIEELETLLDSKNQTLVLKVLTLLKEKQALSMAHKHTALESITNPEIKRIIEVL
ncbi:hypothetical protein IKQ21_06210 [bacterium]|nr:hypothetical protein [bacterium]